MYEYAFSILFNHFYFDSYFNVSLFFYSKYYYFFLHAIFTNLKFLIITLFIFVSVLFFIYIFIYIYSSFSYLFLFLFLHFLFFYVFSLRFSPSSPIHFPIHFLLLSTVNIITLYYEHYYTPLLTLLLSIINITTLYCEHSQGIDATVIQTSLREMEEELGIPAEKAEVTCREIL